MHLHAFLAGFLEGAKEECACVAPGIHQAVYAHTVQLLQAAAVDLQTLEARGHVPNVNKGNPGKLAAPLSSDTDAAQRGHQQVAETLAEVEASV